MDDAARLARNGAPDGLVVVTDYQSAGRGRRSGRVWHAAPCESLMFTLALRNPDAPATRSLAMAVAVALLLEEELALQVRIKWPNDVLVSGRKICGILADHDGSVLTLGVGLNVAQASFPAELPRATSVAMERAANALPPVTQEWPELRDRLLLALLERYLRVAREWQPLLEARLWGRGERVEVRQEGGATLAGLIVGIGSDGRLIVDDGRLHRLAAGEVSLTTERSNA